MCEKYATVYVIREILFHKVVEIESEYEYDDELAEDIAFQDEEGWIKDSEKITDTWVDF